MWNRFLILTAGRVTLLTLTIFLLAWIWGDARLIFNQIIISIIIVIEVLELVRFVNQTNRELSRFFNAIRFDDFAVTYNRKALGKSFRDLQESMRIIADTFKEVKIEKEAQFLLLKALIEQLQVGIITLVENEVVLINAKAQSLLAAKGANTWRVIEQLRPDFTAKVGLLGHGGRRLIEQDQIEAHRILAVEVSTRLILDRETRLITIQDINSEIEEKEIEAWHKLIRILTHEIMNSITPISSLTETMQSLLTDRAGNQKTSKQLNDDTIGDLIFSLNTIHSRSEGLLRFVDDYRRLSRVPKPVPTETSLIKFLSSIQTLLSDNLSRQGIILRVTPTADFPILIDVALMEQVIINLVTNSMHAVEGCLRKVITIDALRADTRLVLEVADTGKGIPESELKDIFVPFYSTKKNGSGIGLSLSKQIVSQHAGTIRVTSSTGVGTRVTITLPNQY